MEEELLKKFEEQEKRLEQIWRSVEKTRKYFLWTIIITVVTFVLPLVVFAVLIPKIISTYTSTIMF